MTARLGPVHGSASNGFGLSAAASGWQSLHLGLSTTLLLGLSLGCKNIVRDSSEAVAGPRHNLDYSYVKFATYRGDRVLSAGEYKGLSSRSDVVDRATADLRKSEPCATGTATTFCTAQPEDERGLPEGTGPTQWIQLFLPDGTSCSVGPAPENAGIPPCLDRS